MLRRSKVIIDQNNSASQNIVEVTCKAFSIHKKKYFVKTSDKIYLRNPLLAEQSAFATRNILNKMKKSLRFLH